MLDACVLPRYFHDNIAGMLIMLIIKIELIYTDWKKYSKLITHIERKYIDINSIQRI